MTSTTFKLPSDINSQKYFIFGHASWATLAQSISSFKNKTDVFTAAQNAEIVNSQRVSLSEEIFMKSKNKYVFKSLR